MSGTLLCLKVRWGYSASYKLMNFPASQSGQETLQQIVTKHTLDPAEKYFLYSPCTIHRGPIWLDLNKALNELGLQDRVSQAKSD
jgi:hypothetical protein